jgi:hypothetical protein
MWSSTGDPSGPAAFEIAFGEPEPLLSRVAAALEAFPDIDTVLRQLILNAVRFRPKNRSLGCDRMLAARRWPTGVRSTALR